MENAVIAKIKGINMTSFRNGVKGTLSVSKMNNFLVAEPFDAEKSAKICEAKGKDNPNYKYYNMTAEQIMESWSEKSAESRRYGTLLDEYTGLILEQSSDLERWKITNGYNYDARLKANCDGFEEFRKQLEETTNYRYVGREIQVFATSEKGNVLNGRLDCLFEDASDESNKKYLIIDWKTTDEISTKNQYKKKLRGPAFNLDDCDMNKYTAQLFIYKKALVETYGIANEENVKVAVCNVLRERNEHNLLFMCTRKTSDTTAIV